MPDPRFFTTYARLTAAEIAEMTAGRLISGSPVTEVSHVAGHKAATPGSLIYTEKAKDFQEVGKSAAHACLIPDGGSCDAVNAQELPVIIAVGSPRGAFARIAARLHDSLLDVLPAPPDNPKEFGHPPVIVPGTPLIAADASVHERAVLYPGCEIREGARIAAGAIIGPGVVIGAQSYIGPNVCVSHAIIGARCHLYSGAVIGEAGFGYVREEGNRRVPQLGRVILGDDVDVGANSTIDRGMLDDTIIGSQTKIDNQVQIGHNVVIGKNCILAAQVGISGSTVIEDNVVFAGRSAAADHLYIGKGAVILAGSGVTKNVPAGETWFGYPARPAAQWRRREAGLNRLLRSVTKQI